MNITTTLNTQSYLATTKDDAKAKKENTNETKPTTETQSSTKVIGSININAHQAAQLEKALENTDISGLIKEAQSLNDDLEVNWNAIVDPQGKIYARTYVESLAKQYENVANTIKDYYASAHQDNLAQGSTTDSMNYLALKYTKLGQEMGSPHYRADMSEAQRQMALRQEQALLLGGRVTLADPFALAASGGVLSGEKADAIARQAAQDKINALIADYQKSKGIGADELDVRV